jgi:hypothetical protein
VPPLKSAPAVRRAIAGALTAFAMALLALPAASAAAAGPELVVDRNSVGGHCSDGRSLSSVSVAAPLCSLDAALKSAPAGSTVVVRRGSYPGIDFTRGLGRGGQLTVRAAEGEQPVVAGFTAKGASGLRVEGVRITGGVTILDSSGIDVVGNDVSPRGITVRPGSSDIQIVANRIHDLSYLPDQMNSGYGVLLSGGGGGIGGVTVRDNRIGGIPVDGIQVTSVSNLNIVGNRIGPVRKPPGSGVHSDAIQLLGARHVRIDSNLIHDTGHGLMNTDNPVYGLTVANNVFARVVSGYGTLLQLAPGATLVNNTYWATRYGVLFRGSATGIRLENNILDRFSSGRSRLRAVDHNIVQSGPRFGPHDSGAHPLFRNPHRLDFRPRAGAPQIDAGGSGGTRRDMFGRRRLGGSDIGAVEYLAGRGFGLRIAGKPTRHGRGLAVRVRAPVACKVRLVAKGMRSRAVSLTAGQAKVVVLHPTGKRSAKKRRVRVRAVGIDLAGDRQTARRILRLRR